ncbi:hypothetical protein HJFPF1_04870 [Paramyrothecium foliicola]|nr:hypothetical protein HJFPF1_04870 [Paramyrothecium foliicola]
MASMYNWQGLFLDAHFYPSSTEPDMLLEETPKQRLPSRLFGGNTRRDPAPDQRDPPAAYLSAPDARPPAQTGFGSARQVPARRLARGATMRHPEPVEIDVARVPRRGAGGDARDGG